jgi:hypothetical protein
MFVSVTSTVTSCIHRYRLLNYWLFILCISGVHLLASTTTFLHMTFMVSYVLIPRMHTSSSMRACIIFSWVTCSRCLSWVLSFTVKPIIYYLIHLFLLHSGLSVAIFVAFPVSSPSLSSLVTFSICYMVSFAIQTIAVVLHYVYWRDIGAETRMFM